MLSTQVVLVLLFAFCNILGLQAYSWSPSSLGLPKNAVQAGYDPNKLPLFVARAKHEGFYILGKALPSQNLAYVGYFYKEYKKEEWEYLVGENFSWVRSYDGLVPRNAVRNELSKGNTLEYVGRQYYNDSLTPGKIVTSLQTLYIPFFGKEYGFDKYEVLVTPSCTCALSEFSPNSLKNPDSLIKN